MQITYEYMMDMAKKASKNAYTPYSKFNVGACALYESGEIYVGCNVENASYGLSLCAERNAMSNAVASGETTKLLAIAIYSPQRHECVPCGACRQWMVEFSTDVKIVLEQENKELKVYSIGEFLPHSFAL